MVQRLILVLLLGLTGWLAYTWLRRWSLSRRRLLHLGLDGFRPGRPAILFFTAPSCTPCHTLQRPELEALQQEFGEQLQLIEVDGLARRELADSWGVLSLPTTFVIDRLGRPRGMNHGVARAERLRAQLAAVGEGPRHTPSQAETLRSAGPPARGV
ncbi:MAG: thioredoxin family protein [Chloroflexota bacterium]